MLADVELIMAFNGAPLPPEIAREMRIYQGNRLQTGEHGWTVLRHIPPGTYAFWPYRGEAEAAALQQRRVGNISFRCAGFGPH